MHASDQPFDIVVRHCSSLGLGALLFASARTLGHSLTAVLDDLLAYILQLMSAPTALVLCTARAVPVHVSCPTCHVGVWQEGTFHPGRTLCNCSLPTALPPPRIRVQHMMRFN